MLQFLFSLILTDPIWEFPYSFTLNHTVEEIYANCMRAQERKSIMAKLIDANRFNALGIESLSYSEPHQMPLNHFLDHAKRIKLLCLLPCMGE